MKYVFAIFSLWTFISCSNSVDYDAFKKSQDYNVPLWVDEYPNKVALFIFPHPDDEIVCAGTIAQLKQSGWQVDLLTLTRGQPEEKSIRSEEWRRAVRSLHVDNSELLDFTNNSWDSVLANKISFWYDHRDTLEHVILRTIQKYRPSLLFTYDTALGGYEHPEHRMTAKYSTNIFQHHQNDSLFSIEKILQITLTDEMEKLALGNSATYKNAIEVNGNSSLPAPTIAFDIVNNWPDKRRAALCYESQAGTLSKFHLLPAVEDTTNHYQTFDREYYSEIKK